MFPAVNRHAQDDQASIRITLRDDTTPRYDEPAAKLAWQRTNAFFNQHLRNTKRLTSATHTEITEEISAFGS